MWSHIVIWIYSMHNSKDAKVSVCNGSYLSGKQPMESLCAECGPGLVWFDNRCFWPTRPMHRLWIRLAQIPRTSECPVCTNVATFPKLDRSDGVSWQLTGHQENPGFRLFEWHNWQHHQRDVVFCSVVEAGENCECKRHELWGTKQNIFSAEPVNMQCLKVLRRQKSCWVHCTDYRFAKFWYLCRFHTIWILVKSCKCVKM